MIKNGMLYVLITALCFATHEPASKLLDGQINPYAITAIRFLIGGLALLPFSIIEIRKKKIKLTGKDFGIMTGLGILFICVSMVLLQVSVAIADSAAIIAIIFSSNSIITIIMSLCVIGVFVAADITGGTNVLSVILAILSALTFSTYTVLCKKFMTKLTGVIQSGISFIIGSLILLVALMIIRIPVWDGVSGGNIVNMLYIAIVVTGIGYWAYFGAIKNGGPQTAALAFLIKPILTPFAAFAITGEPFSSNVLVAVVFVVIGASLAGGVIQNLKKK